MWTVATFQPTGLFSLRPTSTTSSGGQTLLFPSPFSLKMALLSAAIRGWGINQGQEWWPVICNLEIALAGPPSLIVNNTFIKIWRLKKKGADDRDGTGISTPLNSTIAFRAFVSYSGPLQLAFSESERTVIKPTGSASRKKPEPVTTPLPLAALLLQLNYFGKRGGFFQILNLPQTIEQPAFYNEDGKFVRLTSSELDQFPMQGTLQAMDDCASGLNFAQVNVYDSSQLNAKKDRISRSIVLPYSLERSSRSYQLFRRLD